MAYQQPKYYARQNPKIFPQELYEESSTQKLPLGTVWQLADGRAFRYVKNAATGGPTDVSQLIQSAAPISTSYNLEVAVAAVANDDHVHITHGNANVVANFFAEGYLSHDYGTYKGELYKIASHAAVAYATSTAAIIYLSDYVRRAIAVADDVSLIQHPCKDTIICPADTATGVVVGVTPILPTASYYYWIQFRGPCAIRSDAGTLTVGLPVQAYGQTAGACQNMTENEELLIIGQVLYIGAANETAIINLMIP